MVVGLLMTGHSPIITQVGILRTSTARNHRSTLPGSVENSFVRVQDVAIDSTGGN